MEQQPALPCHNTQFPDNLQITNTAMKEQTLKELYTTLDPTEQANMIRFFGAQLFVSPTTAVYYLRGYRQLPKLKQPVLADYAEKTYAVKLKFS